MAQTKAQRRAAWKKRTSATASALKSAGATVTVTKTKKGKKKVTRTVPLSATVVKPGKKVSSLVKEMEAKKPTVSPKVITPTAAQKESAQEIIKFKAIDAELTARSERLAAEKVRAAPVSIAAYGLVSDRTKDVGDGFQVPLADIAAYGHVIDVEKQTVPLKTAKQIAFEQKYPSVTDVDTTALAPHKLKTGYETPYDTEGDRLAGMEDPITEIIPSSAEIGTYFRERHPGITKPVVGVASDILESIREYEKPGVEEKEAELDIQREKWIATAPDISLKKPDDTHIPGPIEKAVLFTGGAGIGAYEGIREHPVKTTAMLGAGLVLPGVIAGVTGIAGAVPIIGTTLARVGVPVAMGAATVHYGFDVVSRVDTPVPTGDIERVPISKQEYIDSYYEQYGVVPELDPKQSYEFYIDVPKERVPTQFERGQVFGEILGTEIIPMSAGIGLTKVKWSKTQDSVFRDLPPSKSIPKAVDRFKKDTRSKSDIAFDKEVIRLQKLADKAADPRSLSDIAFDKEVIKWRKQASIEKELKSDIAFDKELHMLKEVQVLKDIAKKKKVDTRTKADKVFDKEVQRYKDLAFDEEVLRLKTISKGKRTKTDIAFDKEVIRLQKLADKRKPKTKKPDEYKTKEHIQEIPQSDGTVLLTKTVERIKIKPARTVMSEKLKVKKKTKVKETKTYQSTEEELIFGGMVKKMPTILTSIGLGVGIGMKTKTPTKEKFGIKSLGIKPMQLGTIGEILKTKVDVIERFGVPQTVGLLETVSLKFAEPVISKTITKQKTTVGELVIKPVLMTLPKLPEGMSRRRKMTRKQRLAYLERQHLIGDPLTALAGMAKEMGNAGSMFIDNKPGKLSNQFYGQDMFGGILPKAVKKSKNKRSRRSKQQTDMFGVVER